MNIKLNVRNIMVATALGALVLTGCGSQKDAVGNVDVYANNFNNESTYKLAEFTKNYKPIEHDIMMDKDYDYEADLNTESDNSIPNDDYTYMVDNTIEDGDYYTIKETLLINTEENEILAKIGLDTYVKVLGEKDNYYLVDYNGMIGYVTKDSIQNQQYVLYDDDSVEEYKPYTINHMIRALTDVNIREDMSTDSEIIGMINSGDDVRIISHENGWYRIQYGDREAFVKDDYFTEEFRVEGHIFNVVYIIEPTELLKEDSDEAIRSLEFYESAEVLGEVGDYYLVNVDNVVGRIKKDACFELEGKTVVVDLSSQTLKLYDDNEVLLYSKVTTGKDETPTDKGLYSIYSKETDRYLEGEGYKAYVNYWMPFNGGEGFHDATWRESFGGDEYHYGGSHGCVNMELDEAEVLYNNVEVGTKVLIHK